MDIFHAFQITFLFLLIEPQVSLNFSFFFLDLFFHSKVVIIGAGLEHLKLFINFFFGLFDF